MGVNSEDVSVVITQAAKCVNIMNKTNPQLYNGIYKFESICLDLHVGNTTMGCTRLLVIIYDSITENFGLSLKIVVVCP